MTCRLPLMTPTYTPSFRHEGVALDLGAPGWERFLASLEALVAHGHANPFRHAAAA
jgi:hypothetical protein